MDSRVPLGDVLAGLAARMARLREQEAHHAEREAFHHERRAASAAELEKVAEHHEALRRTVAAVEELGILSPPDRAARSPDGLPPGKKATINLAVREILSRIPPDRPFGVREVMEEINRRYAEDLRGPVNSRQVSVSLRWMVRTRRIHRVSGGRSRRVLRYIREKPQQQD